MKVSVHFLSFLKATFKSGQGTSIHCSVLGIVIITEILLHYVFGVGLMKYLSPTPHYLCTDLLKNVSYFSYFSDSIL